MGKFQQIEEGRIAVHYTAKAFDRQINSNAKKDKSEQQNVFSAPQGSVTMPPSYENYSKKYRRSDKQETKWKDVQTYMNEMVPVRDIYAAVR